MNWRYIFFLLMLLLIQIPVRGLAEKTPPNAVVGRYGLYDDKFWFVKNITVEEFEEEGYDVSDKYSSDLEILVNYSYSNYQFTMKIDSISYPVVIVKNIEGEHDLNVTAYGEGEIIAAFSSKQIVNERTYEVEVPNFGVLIDPSFFVLGNQLSVGENLIFIVNRNESLETQWGKNETYVLIADLEEQWQSIKWIQWYDAKSGILLKQIIIQENPVRVSREEMRLVETGIVSPEPTLTPEPTSTQETETKQPGAIPGFNIESVLIGLIISILLHWIQREIIL